MPEVDHLDTTGFAFSPAPEAVPKPAPSFITETIPAAFRLENDVMNLIEYVQRQRSFAPTPDFNPGAKLREIDTANRSALWDTHGKDFIGVRSEDEFNVKLARIQREEADKRILERSGAGGFIAAVAAGTLSPTLAIPFMGQARGFSAAAKSAAVFGFAGGVLQELPLALNQETRTVGESAFSVAASTVVSGILGGAVGALSRNERQLLEQTFEKEMGMALPPGGQAIPAARSAGAMAVDEVSPSAGKLAPGIPDLITATSPVLRTINQTTLPSASHLMAQLSDGGVILEGNAKGIATSVGGSIESLIKTYDATYVRALGHLDEAYTDYFYQGAAKPSMFADTRATIGGYVSPDHLNRSDFKNEVAKALWSQDKHENPFVQKAAEALRKDFFNPLLKEAQNVGLIPDTIDLKGDVSYLTRDYHVPTIKAYTNEFVDILAANYEKQAQKSFEERLAKMQAGQQKTETLLGDLQLSPEEAAKQLESFKTKATQLDDSRMGFVKRAEEEANALRSQARLARKEGDNALADSLLAEARQVETDAGPMLKETREERSAIKQRIRNINKSRVVFEQKQAAKLDKIERLEDINQEALMTAARQGKSFLNRLDDITDKTYAKEVRRLRSAFAEIGDTYDMVVERIGKLSAEEPGTDLNKLLAMEERQGKLGVRLDETLRKLETAEDLQAAVPVLRDIVGEQLQVVLERINKNMTNRVLRGQRLAEQAKKLDPALVTKRIEDLKMASKQKQLEFFDSMRMKGADGAGADLAKGIADFKEYARAIAVEAKDKIIGTYLHAPAIDMVRAERGAELSRAINISSLEIQKFLNKDLDRLLHKQVRTMGPDIELMRKFGSLDWEDRIRPIADEYNARLEQFKGKVEEATAKLKSDTLSVPERTKLEKFVSAENTTKIESALNKEYFDRTRDLRAVYDRLRGDWGIPTDPDAIGYRLGKVALNLNVLRLMGGTLISSIADVGRPIMKHGLTRVFADGFMPLITDLKTFKASAREVRLAGAGLDTILQSRARSMQDLVTDFATTSKFERGVEYATGKMGIVAMFDHWTSAMKQFSGVVANARFLDSVDIVMTGNGTAKELQEATTFLASHGFDGKLTQALWTEMQSGGADKVKGTWLPNTETWKNKDLVRAFRAAVVKNVDDTIIQPGVELPLTMNRTIANRMLFQFKSFGMSSTYKTLAAGLQQRDMAVLNGAMVSLAFGALSYYTYATLTGGKAQETMLNADAAKWADEAIQRSGVIAAFGDAQKIAERLPVVGKYATMSGTFGTGERMQKNAANGLVETALGPSFGFAKTLAEVFAGAEEPTQATLHKLRTLLPFQNLVGFRRLLDAVEQSSGLPERKN